MPPLDPGYLISLAFSCLPAVVGVVGLCLLSRFPRAARGMAISGLVLLTASSVVHLLMELFVFRLLWRAGLFEVSTVVGFLSSFMIAAGLLFLALAATRRDPVDPARPQAEPWQGAPAPHPGMPQPHPGYGQPGPAQPGPGQPGPGHTGPHGGT
ncbi:hypothetical protein [Nocardiopsis nanhaiensis]